MDDSQDEIQKTSAVATTLHGGTGDKGGRQGAERTFGNFKNHTFFIFGWCAAEMRRIIDVSCLPGAGSYS